MDKNVLITGCSSGLGYALCKLYLKKGYKVYGISRTNPKIENENFIFKAFDLSKTDIIKKELSNFITTIKNLEIVYLNAGVLGKIKTLEEISLDEMREVYDINVYANKELLDILSKIKVNYIIAISSGAAINGSKGWASYCMSKSAVNMLINLYAKEMEETKLLAVAPGVVKTPMTDYIRNDVDDTVFTSAKRLKQGEIQSPQDAAVRLDKIFDKLENFSSGSFIDVRNI